MLLLLLLLLLLLVTIMLVLVMMISERVESLRKLRDETRIARVLVAWCAQVA